MKSIKELKTNEHIGMNDYGYGYKQALKDVLKLIDEMICDLNVYNVEEETVECLLQLKARISGK